MPPSRPPSVTKCSRSAKEPSVRTCLQIEGECTARRSGRPHLDRLYLHRIAALRRCRSPRLEYRRGHRDQHRISTQGSLPAACNQATRRIEAQRLRRSNLVGTATRVQAQRVGSTAPRTSAVSGAIPGRRPSPSGQSPPRPTPTPLTPSPGKCSSTPACTPNPTHTAPPSTA